MQAQLRIIASIHRDTDGYEMVQAEQSGLSQLLIIFTVSEVQAIGLHGLRGWAAITEAGHRGFVISLTPEQAIRFDQYDEYIFPFIQSDWTMLCTS